MPPTRPGIVGCNDDEQLRRRRSCWRHVWRWSRWFRSGSRRSWSRWHVWWRSWWRLWRRPRWQCLCMRSRPRGGVHSLWGRLWWRRTWLRCHVICGNWPGRIHTGDDLQVHWGRRRLRRSSAKKRFHLHHYRLLPVEFVATAPSVVLASVRNRNHTAVRLRCWILDVGNSMVPGTAGLLLQHYGQGLRHHKTRHGSARAANAHATAHTATNATAHAAPNAATHAATYSSSAVWPSGPIQLRCG